MTESFKDKILVVLPAYNEEGKIGKMISNMSSEWIHEVVVVNDGSTDNTEKESRDAGATLINQPRNMGVGAAIRAGIKYALEKRYDIVVVMGGDDQDNISEIGRLLRPILYDEFDFVQGSRYMAGGMKVNIPLFRRFSTGLFSWIFKKLTRYPITDGTNGYRAFHTSIFENENINLDQDWLNNYELEPYLLYKTIKSGFRVTEAPVTKRYPKDRKVGYTKMIPIVSWWSILRPLIFLRFGIKK
jgi:dolichol-phosphate mannosyltransferase